MAPRCGEEYKFRQNNICVSVYPVLVVKYMLPIYTTRVTDVIDIYRWTIRKNM